MLDIFNESVGSKHLTHLFGAQSFNTAVLEYILVRGAPKCVNLSDFNASCDGKAIDSTRTCMVRSG